VIVAELRAIHGVDGVPVSDLRVEKPETAPDKENIPALKQVAGGGYPFPRGPLRPTASPGSRSCSPEVTTPTLLTVKSRTPG
jgi:hypothetical protein